MGSGVQLSYAQYTTQIQDEMGKKIGSSVRQETLRKAKQWDYFCNQLGYSQCFLVWDREYHRPLGKEILNDHDMSVTSFCTSIPSTWNGRWTGIG